MNPSLYGFFIVVAVVLGTAVAHEKAHPKSRASANIHVLKNEAERQTAFWNAKAQSILTEKLQKLVIPDVPKPAKNIIMFLGDGMSVHTVTATRNLIGDSSEQVSFEKFPFFGLSKTYCVDRQVADSACTATAYLSGVKGNYGTIGVNAQVPRYHCQLGNNPAYWAESIAKWAQDANKNAGLVTTARVTHASPAGVYAHTADRNWENDAEIIKSNCGGLDIVDIARQLIEWPVGKQLKVIMGGGRQNFLNETVRDEEGIAGSRLDGRHLINEWLEDKRAQNLDAKYVWSKRGLSQVDLENTEYLMGLFSNSHCPYHGDLKREHLENSDPSLTEMTEAAIKVLNRNENGYFLFVEGAKIDMAHHETRARKSLEDTEEFARAVQKARDMTSEEETLIIVTSDHSHTMTINGYPYRDQKITGLAPELGDDNKPYTILSYANGQGFYNTYSAKEGRAILTEKQLENPAYQYMASVPLSSETHGGDDVGVFASGPYSQFFSGNFEQTNIPAMMARAANIGPFANV